MSSDSLRSSRMTTPVLLPKSIWLPTSLELLDCEVVPAPRASRAVYLPSSCFTRARRRTSAGLVVTPSVQRWSCCTVRLWMVDGSRTCDLQPRARAESFDPAVLLQTRQTQACRLVERFRFDVDAVGDACVPVLVQNALKCPIAWTSPKTSACSLAAMASPSATTNGRGRAAVQGVESGFGARAVVIATARTEASAGSSLIPFLAESYSPAHRRTPRWSPRCAAMIAKPLTCLAFVVLGRQC